MGHRSSIARVLEAMKLDGELSKAGAICRNLQLFHGLLRTGLLCNKLLEFREASIRAPLAERYGLSPLKFLDLVILAAELGVSFKRGH